MSVVTRIRTSEELAVPFTPEEVWSVLADVSSYPDWWPGKLDIRVLFVKVGLVGSEFEVRPWMGRMFRGRFEELDEPHAMRIRFFGGAIEGPGGFLLSPTEKGTQIRYEIDVFARGMDVAVLNRIVPLEKVHSMQMRSLLGSLAKRLRAVHKEAEKARIASQRGAESAAKERTSGATDAGVGKFTPERAAEKRATEKAARKRAQEETQRLARDKRNTQRVQEEATRVAEELALFAAEAEARLRADEEASRRRAADAAARVAAETAARRAAESEAARVAQELAHFAAEAEARLRADEEASRRRAAEEAARVAAETKARRAAESEAARVAEELAHFAAEAEARLRADEEAARRRAAEDAARVVAEIAARRRAETEAARVAEELAYFAAEAEARLRADEEAARRRAEDEAARAAAEMVARKAAENRAAWAAEEEARLAAEAEARLRADEEAARRRAAEEAARVAAETTARRSAEREAARLAAEETAIREAQAASARRAQEEKRLAEEELSRQHADEARAARDARLAEEGLAIARADAQAAALKAQPAVPPLATSARVIPASPSSEPSMIGRAFKAVEDWLFESPGSLATGPSEKRPSTEKSNFEIAREYLKALSSSASADDIGRFFSAEAVEENYPNRFVEVSEIRNLPGIIEQRARDLRRFSRQSHQLRGATGGGTQVAMEILWKGTLAEGSSLGEQGQELEARMALMLKFTKGRIARMRTYICFEPWSTQAERAATLRRREEVAAARDTPRLAAPPPGLPRAPLLDSNFEIARGLLEALSGRAAAETIGAFYAADAVQEELPNRLLPEGVVRDREGLIEARRRRLTLLTSERYELRGATGGGSQVAMEVLWTGVVGKAAGQFKEGQRLEARFALFLKYHEGRIVRHRTYECPTL